MLLLLLLHIHFGSVFLPTSTYIWSNMQKANKNQAFEIELQGKKKISSFAEFYIWKRRCISLPLRFLHTFTSQFLKSKPFSFSLPWLANYQSCTLQQSPWLTLWHRPHKPSFLILRRSYNTEFVALQLLPRQQAQIKQYYDFLAGSRRRKSWTMEELLDIQSDATTKPRKYKDLCKVHFSRNKFFEVCTTLKFAAFLHKFQPEYWLEV